VTSCSFSRSCGQAGAGRIRSRASRLQTNLRLCPCAQGGGQGVASPIPPLGCPPAQRRSWLRGSAPLLFLAGWQGLVSAEFREGPRRTKSCTQPRVQGREAAMEIGGGPMSQRQSQSTDGCMVISRGGSWKL
jgi:hypothetical protein